MLTHPLPSIEKLIDSLVVFPAFAFGYAFFGATETAAFRSPISWLPLPSTTKNGGTPGFRSPTTGNGTTSSALGYAPVFPTYATSASPAFPPVGSTSTFTAFSSATGYGTGFGSYAIAALIPIYPINGSITASAGSTN